MLSGDEVLGYKVLEMLKKTDHALLMGARSRSLQPFCKALHHVQNRVPYTRLGELDQVGMLGLRGEQVPQLATAAGTFHDH